MNNISDRIRVLRKSEHLTQKEFAKRLLISQSYLSGLENGNEIPTNKLLKLICLEFGVSESWLLNDNGEMYTEVYENDKASLTEVSNGALLKIMTLLSTKSNVEYGFYANSLSLFSNMLDCSHLGNRNIDMGHILENIIYLELLTTLVMDLDRMVYVSFNNKDSKNIDKHKQVIRNDLDAFFNYIVKTDIPSL